jgi:hypothetical protein
VIHDHDYSGKIDIQFTSGYDCVLRRWVPVLISVIFGRTKKHFAAHWKWLFESYGCQDDWQQFTTLFPGLTLDWSDAEGESFLDELVSFAKGQASRSDVLSYLRKCDVHFKRSLTRVVRNGRIAATSEAAEEFRHLVSTMQLPTTTVGQFGRASNLLARRFPAAVSWLAWHLHPSRAPCYFPACQKFDAQEHQRFNKLSSTTNAQENIGKQFQELFMVNS